MVHITSRRLVDQIRYYWNVVLITVGTDPQETHATRRERSNFSAPGTRFRFSIEPVPDASRCIPPVSPVPLMFIRMENKTLCSDCWRRITRLHCGPRLRGHENGFRNRCSSKTFPQPVSDRFSGSSCYGAQVYYPWKKLCTKLLDSRRKL